MVFAEVYGSRDRPLMRLGMLTSIVGVEKQVEDAKKAIVSQAKDRIYSLIWRNRAN